MASTPSLNASNLDVVMFQNSFNQSKILIDCKIQLMLRIFFLKNRISLGASRHRIKEYYIKNFGRVGLQLLRAIVSLSGNRFRPCTIALHNVLSQTHTHFFHQLHASLLILISSAHPLFLEKRYLPQKSLVHA